MEEKAKIWLDWFAQVTLRLPWPSNKLLQIISIALSGLTLTTITAIVWCLPDLPASTLLNILDPVNPAALIFVATLGCGLAAAGVHYGIALLHRCLLELPSHVLTVRTRDLIWQQVCTSIGRANFFSFKWTHSLWGMVWVAVWVAFIVHTIWIINLTIQIHTYTKLYLMGIVGIGATSVLYTGFSVLYSGLCSIKRIETQIRRGLQFDPADQYSQGGLTPLMNLVDRFIWLWSFLAVLTWGVAFRVLASSNAQIPSCARWAIHPALMLPAVSYPLHERAVIAFILFLELGVTFLLLCVWRKGVRWIAEGKKQIGERLAERVRQQWNADPAYLLASIAQLQLVKLSGTRSVGSQVCRSVLLLAQLGTVVEWLINLLKL